MERERSEDPMSFLSPPPPPPSSKAVHAKQNSNVRPYTDPPPQEEVHPMRFDPQTASVSIISINPYTEQ
jgi:hypothetical protein